MSEDPEDDAGREDDAIEVRRVRRNPWVMGAAAIPFALVPLALAAAVLVGNVGPALLTFHAVLFGTLATYYAWHRNPWPRLERVSLRADAAALRIGEEEVPRDEIKAGYLVPEGDGVRVQLARGLPKPAIDLRVEDEAEGLRVLERLGLDASHTVARFRAMSRPHSSTLRLMGAAFGAVAGSIAASGALQLLHPALGPVGMITGITLLIALLFVPSRVSVGADGVLVRWLGRERFIPHTEIAGVREGTAGVGRNRRSMVWLDLTSGETYAIPVSAATWDGGRAKALAARVEQARAVYRSREGAPAALLARGRRSHRDWVAALRAGPLGGLRDATASPDGLWRVVEDPGGAPLERAAAAIALGRSRDPDTRARLARAAETTAAPRLRVALERVAADGDEEELAEALVELEREAPGRGAAR